MQCLDARLLHEAELDVVATSYAKHCLLKRSWHAWHAAASEAAAARARAERHQQVWGRIRTWLDGDTPQGSQVQMQSKSAPVAPSGSERMSSMPACHEAAAHEQAPLPAASTGKKSPLDSGTHALRHTKGSGDEHSKELAASNAGSANYLSDRLAAQIDAALGDNSPQLCIDDLLNDRPACISPHAKLSNVPGTVPSTGNSASAPAAASAEEANWQSSATQQGGAEQSHDLSGRSHAALAAKPGFRHQRSALARLKRSNPLSRQQQPRKAGAALQASQGSSATRKRPAAAALAPSRPGNSSRGSDRHAKTVTQQGQSSAASCFARHTISQAAGQQAASTNVTHAVGSHKPFAPQTAVEQRKLGQLDVRGRQEARAELVATSVVQASVVASMPRNHRACIPVAHAEPAELGDVAAIAPSLSPHGHAPRSLAPSQGSLDALLSEAAAFERQHAAEPAQHCTDPLMVAGSQCARTGMHADTPTISTSNTQLHDAGVASPTMQSPHDWLTQPGSGSVQSVCSSLDMTPLKPALQAGWHAKLRKVPTCATGVDVTGKAVQVHVAHHTALCVAHGSAASHGKANEQQLGAANGAIARAAAEEQQSCAVSDDTTTGAAGSTRRPSEPASLVDCQAANVHTSHGLNDSVTSRVLSQRSSLHGGSRQAEDEGAADQEPKPNAKLCSEGNSKRTSVSATHSSECDARPADTSKLRGDTQEPLGRDAVVQSSAGNVRTSAALRQRMGLESASESNSSECSSEGSGSSSLDSRLHRSVARHRSLSKAPVSDDANLVAAGQSSGDRDAAQHVHGPVLGNHRTLSAGQDASGTDSDDDAAWILSRVHTLQR